jgi:hypothetical protein
MIWAIFLVKQVKNKVQFSALFVTSKPSVEAKGSLQLKSPPITAGDKETRFRGARVLLRLARKCISKLSTGQNLEFLNPNSAVSVEISYVTSHHTREHEKTHIP